MIIVTATSRIKEGKTEEFLEVVKKLVPQVRAEQGNISYRLTCEANDPQNIMFVEEWEDMAALGAHSKAPHMAEAVPLMKPLQETPSVITVRQILL